MSEAEALFRVQRLQFHAKQEAEALLVNIVGRLFPELGVAALELRPQATSLNSFNGFLTTSQGQRLFFKTHVEQDSAINEYYNAQLLSDAGYPVIQPLYSSTRDGQQLLIYPVIDDPPIFDLARQIERLSEFDGDLANSLAKVQREEDVALAGRYRATFDVIDAAVHARAPIHQLFWHRVAGLRYERFYGPGTVFRLPGFDARSSEVHARKWVVNGIAFNSTLGELVQRAIDVLKPLQAGVSIVGHGDAHNGNVFFRRDGLVYFDPAFAGRHDPLLDLVKPLYHNVHAMWMYFPDEEATGLEIDLRVEGDTWVINHNYTPNPIRQMFWDSKVEACLRPLVTDMASAGRLPSNWTERIRLALMCCPLLTMNLTGFRPEIALLGLAHCIEMGSEAADRSTAIDRLLSEIQSDLR